jgi:hypothetical protein
VQLSSPLPLPVGLGLGLVDRAWVVVEVARRGCRPGLGWLLAVVVAERAWPR